MKESVAKSVCSIDTYPGLDSVSIAEIKVQSPARLDLTSWFSLEQLVARMIRIESDMMNRSDIKKALAFARANLSIGVS